MIFLDLIDVLHIYVHIYIYVYIYTYISVSNEQKDVLSNLEAFSICEDWAPVAGDLSEGKYDTAGYCMCDRRFYCAFVHILKE